MVTVFLMVEGEAPFSMEVPRVPCVGERVTWEYPKDGQLVVRVFRVQAVNFKKTHWETRPTRGMACGGGMSTNALLDVVVEKQTARALTRDSLRPHRPIWDDREEAP